MTRLTAILIQSDPEIIAQAFGPLAGKFGIYIGTMDKSPSGCNRPRALLTSEAIYNTEAEAIAAGTKALADIRAMDLEATE